MFIKYQHIERWGTDEVEGIEFGNVYVQPKIDGTNGVIWFEDGRIKFGSRTRELDGELDNQGFKATILSDSKLMDKFNNFFKENAGRRLFGEYLIPHSLKTYTKTAWNKFYVFDVGFVDCEEVKYLNYDEYKPILENCGIEYIPVIANVINGTYEQFVALLEKNDYLIEDGKGVGEGIVLKRYDYQNKYGRTTWSKIVRSEFKEIHAKVMGGAVIKGEKMVESEAVEMFLTAEVIDKVFQKIKNDGGWNSKQIPRLLSTVFYEFVTEEIWHILKEFKNPKIDFKTLNFFVINKIKQTKPELF